VASEWYYAREGQSVGPVDMEELRRLADNGELQRTDLVWTAPMEEWTEAGGFDEIFPSLVHTAPPVEPVAPLPGGAPVPPVAPAAPQGRQFQGRAAQGGRQGRGARGGYGGRRTKGVPPIVLVGFIISIVGVPLCSCFPVPLVGAILCMVGLSEAKRRKEGVGLATAGIVIGLLFFLIGIVAIVFSMATNGGAYNF